MSTKAKEKTAVSKVTVTAPVELGDQFQNLTAKEWENIMFKDSGEMFEGVFMGIGKIFGEGTKTVETYCFARLNSIEETPDKCAVGQHTVIKSAISKLAEKDGLDALTGNVYCRITFLGVVESKDGNKYKNFRVDARKTTLEERSKAMEILNDVTA